MSDKVLLVGSEREVGLKLARILINLDLDPSVADWYGFHPRNYSRFRKPRLIIVNCDHPHARPMDEFSSLIRKHWGEAFPIVALTRSQKFRRIAGLLDAGADDCLSPDSPELLLERKITLRLTTNSQIVDKTLAEEIPARLLSLFHANPSLVRLGDLISVHAGAAPRSAWARRDAPPDNSWRRVVTAENIGKFHIARSTTYLMWSKLHLFRVPQEDEYSVPEKVVLSRVAPPVIAAVDKQRLPVGADVYSLVPKEGTTASYVACLLNSRLLDFYFNRLAKIQDGRLRPEVIRDTPVPKPTAAANRDCTRFASLLTHFGPNQENWIDRESQKETREQMDNVILQLYGADDPVRSELEGMHF